MIFLLIGCDLVMAGLTVGRLNSIPPQLPLFYSRPWGEDQLVDWWMIFLLPLLMNLFYFSNLFVYNKYFNGNILVEKVINYFNIFLTLSMTVIYIKVLLMTS